MDQDLRKASVELIARQFISGIEEMERVSGLRRDLILEGFELALKRLRESPPTRQ